MSKEKANFLTSNEIMERNENISDGELVRGCVEMYSYWFKRARENEEDEFSQGALEGISAMTLQILGGRQFYQLWQACINWLSDDTKD